MQIFSKDWFDLEENNLKNYLNKLQLLPKNDIVEKSIKKIEHQILCLENRKRLYLHN